LTSADFCRVFPSLLLIDVTLLMDDVRCRFFGFSASATLYSDTALSYRVLFFIFVESLFTWALNFL